MNNNVLVCVSNKNIEKLVEKGEKIANAYGGNCIILNVAEKEYDEYDYYSFVHKKEIENIASKFDAEFIYVPQKNKKLYENIASVVLEKEIGHVIIGQPVRSKWDIIRDGSLINELFKELDDVDLHIVEIEKEAEYETEYDRGTDVQLDMFDGDFESFFGSETIKNKQGIFYKSSSTEFANGMIRISKVENGKKEDFLFKVSDNKILF